MINRIFSNFLYIVRIVIPSLIILCAMPGQADSGKFVYRDLAVILTEQFGEKTISAVVETNAQEGSISIVLEKINQISFELEMTHVYQNGNNFDVTGSLKGLDWLVQQSEVRRVATDFELQPNLKQGLALIGADQIRDEFDGSGVAIAIIDSGIDPTHPMLGGSKACDAENFVNSKIIGGWDTGEKDPLPCDSARHGTSVAGIAAGLIPGSPSGPNGDYVGGVAPGAKIYALKITKANGRPGSNAYLSALRWVADHWNDDPENPILVVNNSNTWNKVVLNASCENSDSRFEKKIVKVLAELTKLGITVFNSAGNSGYTNGIQWPGCMDRVQSVGAVVDTNDKVQSSSNSGALLDFYAPASLAITTVPNGKYRKFGTTSAATPYAAGSAAVVQQAAKQKLGHFLTPDQLLVLLSASGDLVMDEKSDPPIERPRINLKNAIEQLH